MTVWRSKCYTHTKLAAKCTLLFVYSFSGRWCSPSTVLLVSCLRWCCFAITCQIEKHVTLCSIMINIWQCLSVLHQSNDFTLTFYFYGFHRYVPNELRGGMITLSQAPANMVFLLFLVQVGPVILFFPGQILFVFILSSHDWKVHFCLVILQRGYYRTVANSTIIAFAAFGLFSAAGCMYMLKRPGKQLYQNWHKLWCICTFLPDHLFEQSCIISHS